ncbi:unnamed protein product [Choristocarpus tenellus]
MPSKTSAGPSRRNGGRGKRQSPCLIFCFFGVIVVLWIGVTFSLVPAQLANMSAQISTQARREQESRLEDEGSSLDNGGQGSLQGMQQGPALRAGGNRQAQAGVTVDGSRKELAGPAPPQLTMEEIIKKMQSFLEELHRVFTALPAGPVSILL